MELLLTPPTLPTQFKAQHPRRQTQNRMSNVHTIDTISKTPTPNSEPSTNTINTTETIVEDSHEICLLRIPPTPSELVLFIGSSSKAKGYYYDRAKADLSNSREKPQLVAGFGD
ncbi:uncharacterized protein EAF01_006142 [Botrytis porri]|uniref:uncharacterized protein n=1 Tax=Botrytis porri TaxID=87229 RepID=UPI00190275AC|nr:uncharacterized protein EAF01_006142 [Botrytis porri]KAF7905621.1 hypothetical protein EAF01_006142 [Botrytis porri]